MALGHRGAWRSIVLAVSVVLAGCGGGERPAAPAASGGPAGPAAGSAGAVGGPSGPPAASSGSPTTPAGQAAGSGAGASGPSAVAPAGAAAAAALQALIEGARREGQLTLTWSENSLGGAEGARRWAEGFNRLYGLNVDVRFTPGISMPEMSTRITQEYQAGRPASSDVYLGTEVHVALMLQAGSLQPLDWAAWSPTIQNPALVAPDGVAVAITSVLPGIAYNSTKLRGDEVPRSLPDLLKPEYKGRIASTTYAGHFDRLASPDLWGEPRTVEYVTRLADQVAGLMRCGEVSRLASGEFDLFALDCGSYEARRWSARGAPIAHVIPSDAAFLQHWYMGVPKNAAHPNAAALWVSYVLSREGQDVLWESEYTDHHLVPGSRSAEEIDKLRAAGVPLVEVDVEFVQRHETEDISRIRGQLQGILRKQ